MKLYFTQYFKQLIIITLILAIVALLWNLIFPLLKIAAWWPFYLIFFFIITSLSHYILFKSLQHTPKKFIGTFMAITLGKLVIYLVAIIINIMYAPFSKLSVIVPFLFFYIVYTFFEVKQLMRVAGKNTAVAGSDQKDNHSSR